MSTTVTASFECWPDVASERISELRARVLQLMEQVIGDDLCFRVELETRVDSLPAVRD